MLLKYHSVVCCCAMVMFDFTHSFRNHTQYYWCNTDKVGYVNHIMNNNEMIQPQQTEAQWNHVQI